MELIKSKILFYLALFTFIVLIIFSYVFYLERVMLLDMPYHIFMILKKNNFAIQNYRYIAYITQSVPLFASRLAFSLKIISILYSLTFSVLYFIIFIIIYKLIKNEKVALGFFLFNIIICTHTFYWPLTELHQGIAFLFIFIALIDHSFNQIKKLSICTYIVCIICIVLLGVSHPLNLFAFVFIISFFVINNTKLSIQLIPFVLLYFGIYYYKNVINKAAHDDKAIGYLSNIFIYFPKYYKLQSFKNFYQYVLKDYYFIPIVLLLINLFYLKNKKIIKLILVNSSVFAYTFIVNITYCHGADQFYLENQYMMIGFFIGFVFVYELYNEKKYSTYFVTIFCIISILGIWRIYDTHKFYSIRNEWFRQKIKAVEISSNKKVIYTANNIPHDTVVMNWAFSYETWLLSTIENNKSSSLNVEESDAEYDTCYSKKTAFIAKDGAYEYSKLNPKYFIFTDTVSTYIKVK